MPLQTVSDSASTNTATAVPPMARLLELLFGKHIAYSVSAVAHLGVADHMGGDYPVDVKTLARKVGAQPVALCRVLHVAAGAGVFEETSEGNFRLTPVGELLKSDIPGSMRYTAMQMGDPWSVRPWEHFADTIRTGIDGVTQAFGKNVFEVLADQPEWADHFNRSMSAYSGAMTDAMLDAYDFASIHRLADVGGGHGKLLAAVLSRYPEMTGVVYDLPEVVAGALDDEHVLACRERLSFEAGSFFERVPSDCDAYLMKFILHDWSDEHCKTILKCIREQLPLHGRVLVVEQIIESSPELSITKLLDLEMLALTVGGRERTEAEFSELFASAGLKLTRVFRTTTPMCVLEARLA